RRRIGSAVSEGLLRIVYVSTDTSIIMSWRCEKRSSSRMSGTEKSFWVERWPPRSSTTIFNPVGPSSLAMMPPVQPMPMMTISTGGSLVAMIVLPSTHVCNADRVRHETATVAVFLDVLGIVGIDAGKAQHLPSDLVPVAAVDRVGKHAFHHVLIE